MDIFLFVTDSYNYGNSIQMAKTQNANAKLKTNQNKTFI